MKTETEQIKESMHVVDLHPSLEETVRSGGLNPEKLTVGLATIIDPRDLAAREEVIVTDGVATALWKVPSLRALLRGDAVAPAMPNMPPPAYLPLFRFIEHHVLTFSDAFGDKTDGEFEDAYQTLRRRPDGKSLTQLHFFLWQVAAGLLGKRPVSPAEFETIFSRLTRSASTFQLGLVSRNYVSALRMGMP